MADPDGAMCAMRPHSQPTARRLLPALPPVGLARRPKRGSLWFLPLSRGGATMSGRWTRSSRPSARRGSSRPTPTHTLTSLPPRRWHCRARSRAGTIRRRHPLLPRHRPGSRKKLKQAVAEFAAAPAQARFRRGPQRPGQRPERPGEAGGGDRRVPHRDPDRSRLRSPSLQPRLHAGSVGEAGRGDRRIPRCDPDRSRRRLGPRRTRPRPARPGEAGGSDRRVPHGDPARPGSSPGPTPTSAWPSTNRGKWTRRSPNFAQRSGSIPTSP